MNLLWALLAQAGMIGLGAVVVLFLLPRYQGRRQAAEFWGLSICLGIGLTTCLVFVVSLLGGAWMTSVFRAGAGAATVAGLVIGTVIQRRMTWDCSTTIGRAAAATIAALIALTAMLNLQTPMRFWDERGNYGMKAQVLAFDRTIHSTDLHHPYFCNEHPRYPLLVSLAEATIYLTMGVLDDRWAKLPVVCLYAGLVLTVAGALARRHGSTHGWTWALVLAVVPILSPYDHGFVSAQVDAPVACFHGLTVLYLIETIQRHRWRPLALATLAATLAQWTKNEGLSWWAVDGATVCLAALVQRRRFIMVAALVFIVLPHLLLVPWYQHRTGLPTAGDMRYFERLTPERLWDNRHQLPEITGHLLHRMFVEMNHWGWQWWALVLAVLARPRRLCQDWGWIYLWDWWGCLAALTLAVLIAPVALESHLYGSSHRVLVQLAPVAVLAMAQAWRPDRHSR